MLETKVMTRTIKNYNFLLWSKLLMKRMIGLIVFPQLEPHIKVLSKQIIMVNICCHHLHMVQVSLNKYFQNRELAPVSLLRPLRMPKCIKDNQSMRAFNYKMAMRKRETHQLLLVNRATTKCSPGFQIFNFKIRWTIKTKKCLALVVERFNPSTTSLTLGQLESKSMLIAREFLPITFRPRKLFSNLGRPIQFKIIQRVAIRMKGIAIKEYFWKIPSLLEWSYKPIHQQIRAVAVQGILHLQTSRPSPKLNQLTSKQCKMFHPQPKNNKLQALVAGPDLAQETLLVKTTQMWMHLKIHKITIGRLMRIPSIPMTQQMPARMILMILDSKFQLPCRVTSREIQIFNLLKFKLYYSAKILLLWTQKQSNLKIMSLRKPVKRSVESLSPMQLIQIKELLEIIMKIESQLFWIFLSLRTRLILILSGLKSASLVCLMATVVQLVPIT